MKLRLVIGFAVIAAGLANAQSFRGSIFGTVVNDKGAAIAQANVKASNVDTGLTRQTVTASDGEFGLPELPLGTYDLTVTKNGFRIQTTTSIRVMLPDPARIRVQMTPGQAAQRIEVPAEAPLTHTNSNT